jgi:hypothetical protein
MSVEPTFPRGISDAPAESSVHIVSPETLESGPVGNAVRYWHELRGEKCFPARANLSIRKMSSFLRNIVLLRVIDGGHDYEYRVVGDAHVQAHQLNFRQMRLKQIEATAPNYGKETRATYEHVRTLGVALAVRGWIGRDVPDSNFCYYETVFLPLGADSEVDHILIVTSYVPRAGVADFDKSKLKDILG